MMRICCVAKNLSCDDDQADGSMTVMYSELRFRLSEPELISSRNRAFCAVGFRK